MKPGVSYAVPPKADKKRPVKSGEFSDKEFCLLIGVQEDRLHACSVLAYLSFVNGDT